MTTKSFIFIPFRVPIEKCFKGPGLPVYRGFLAYWDRKIPVYLLAAIFSYSDIFIFKVLKLPAGLVPTALWSLNNNTI